MMSEMQIQNVLQQMRQLTQTSGIDNTNPVQGASRTEGTDFQKVLTESLRSVNEVQQEASDLRTRFELGDDQVSLPQVMTAMGKSSIAFDATNQVRNRLLSAYQQIMRMRV
jgi:flagellar hook-basal body complex protein FliE